MSRSKNQTVQRGTAEQSLPLITDQSLIQSDWKCPNYSIINRFWQLERQEWRFLRLICTWSHSYLVYSNITWVYNPVVLSQSLSALNTSCINIFLQCTSWCSPESSLFCGNLHLSVEHVGGRCSHEAIDNEQVVVYRCDLCTTEWQWENGRILTNISSRWLPSQI